MDKSLYICSRPGFFVYFVVVVCSFAATLCFINMLVTQPFQQSLGLSALCILLAFIAVCLFLQKTVIDERGVHVCNFNTRSLPYTWKTVHWEDMTAIAVSEPLEGPCYRGFNLVVRGKDDREVLIDVFLYRNHQRVAQMLIEQAWEHNTAIQIDQVVLQHYGHPPFWPVTAG